MDIDVDYDYAHKDEVVASEAESNGKDCFSKIQTFGTMKAKNVLRDCARVAGYPVSVGNTLAKFIPDKILDEEKGEMTNKVTLNRCYAQIPELVSFIKEYKLEELWSIALKLEGLKKSSSTHACGHIPTPVPCEELYPVSLDKSGYLVCQYNMTEAEHLGNLKKDLLMLRNLTIIDAAHTQIKKRYGIELPLWTDEILNDKEALNLISSGKTDGIFQLESEGMKKFLKELKPTCFEDVIAGVSLYRPGPMDYIPQYIEGKKHPESVTYLTPELEPILKPTYGVIVYQEQVMQIVRALAGFSMARADLVRKAMGKKQDEIMEAEGKNFIYGNGELGIPGCVKNGIVEETAIIIYDRMKDFAKYAFNKSHAACYAAISMQTAYLKAHYMTEYEAGLLTSVMDNTKKMSCYYMEAVNDGVCICKPDINSSGIGYGVAGDNELYFGLAAIKGVGENIVHSIIEEREKNGNYKSFTDFLKRNPDADKGAVIALIKAGAFDGISTRSRRAMVNAAESDLIKGIRKEQRSMIQGQMSLFDFSGNDDTVYVDSFEQASEYSRKELLRNEKDVTGVYLSGSPLDEYKAYISRTCNTICGDFITDEDAADEQNMTAAEKAEIPEKVVIAGILSKVKEIVTKKGQDMAFLTIEDQTGSVDVTVFPTVYEKYRNILAEKNIDNVICITGKTDYDGEKYTLIADTVSDLSQLPKTVYLRFHNMQAFLKNKQYIDSFIRKHTSAVHKDNIFIYLDSEKQGKLMQSCFAYSQPGVEELQQKYTVERVYVRI